MDFHKSHCSFQFHLYTSISRKSVELWVVASGTERLHTYNWSMLIIVWIKVDLASFEFVKAAAHIPRSECICSTLAVYSRLQDEHVLSYTVFIWTKRFSLFPFFEIYVYCSEWPWELYVNILSCLKCSRDLTFFSTIHDSDNVMSTKTNFVRYYLNWTFFLICLVNYLSIDIPCR